MKEHNNKPTKLWDIIKNTSLVLAIGLSLALVAGMLDSMQTQKAQAQPVPGYFNGTPVAYQAGTNGLNGTITNSILANTTYTNFFRVNCIGFKSVTFEFDTACLTNLNASSNVTWGIYGNVTGAYPTQTNGLYGYNLGYGFKEQYLALITNFVQTLSSTQTGSNNVALLTLPAATLGAIPYLYLATINPQFDPTNTVVRVQLNQ